MKVVIFGSVPPPVGGVTKSIQNLLFALKSKHIPVDLFSKTSLTSRYDISHIHYSKSWKRFVGLLLGKIISKKTIFTLHGNHYKDDIFNVLNAKLADGVILLNETTESKYSDKFKNTVILSSIFSEGMEKPKIAKDYFEHDENKIYLLVYAYDKVYQDEKDIYGVDFMLESLPSLDDKYVVVLLDPKGAYREEVKQINTESFIYLDYEVDFLSLLSGIDIYWRPTTTDGSSVAVQEALLLGKKVLASDVVERPLEVTTYTSGDLIDFTKKLSTIKEINTVFSPNSIDDYLIFCNDLLERK